MSSINSYYLVNDGGEQYYVNAVTRQSLWELPWGGKVIGRVDAQDPALPAGGAVGASARSLSPRSASPALIRSAAVPASTPPPTEISTFVATAVAAAEARLRDACAAAIASAATANEEKLTRTVTDICHAAFAEMSEAVMSSVTEAETRMLARVGELVQSAEARTDGRVMASIAAAIRDSEARIDARVVRAFSGISEALNARAAAPPPSSLFAHVPSVPSSAAAYYATSPAAAMADTLPAPAYASTSDPVRWTPSSPPFPRSSQGAAAALSPPASSSSSITTIERRALAGLSLEGLLAVVAMLGGRAALEGRTTASVKNAVLRMTGDTASSVCALLRARDGFSSGLIGVATVFVSHAYDAPFLDVIDAIAAWESGGGDSSGSAPAASAPRGVASRPPIYFVDLFVINLHGLPPLIPFDALRTDFIGGIRAINNTLLVLDAFAPGALSRLWCLFESAATLAAGGRFDVVLPPRTAADFTATVLNDFEGLVRRMSAVDAERAATHDLNDAANLSRAIADELGGFARVNDLVRGGVRDWLTRAGRTVLRAIDENARPISALQRALTLLLLERGARDEAEPLLRTALAGWRGALGDAHPTTLKAAEDFANFLTAGGRLSDASAVRAFMATSQGTSSAAGSGSADAGSAATAAQSQSAASRYIAASPTPAAAPTPAPAPQKTVSFASPSVGGGVGVADSTTQLAADAQPPAVDSGGQPAPLPRSTSSRRPAGIPPPEALSPVVAPSDEPAPLVRSASSRRPPGIPPPDAIIGAEGSGGAASASAPPPVSPPTALSTAATTSAAAPAPTTAPDVAAAAVVSPQPKNRPAGVPPPEAIVGAPAAASAVAPDGAQSATALTRKSSGRPPGPPPPEALVTGGGGAPAAAAPIAPAASAGAGVAAKRRPPGPAPPEAILK